MKMKKALLSFIACALMLVMTVAVAACGEEPKPDTVTITAIKLEETADLDTGVAKNVIVEITYSDGSTKKANDSAIEWESSNEAVATVNNGRVGAKAQGTANITATAGTVTSNTCAVTVHSLTLALDKTEIALNKSESEQLTATVERDGKAVTDAEIEWSSSDDKIATVKDGLVTAWDEGEATITAKLSGGQSATCKVTATWTKPVGYKEMEFAEQNKLHPGAWGYWNAQDGWGQGLAKANAQYTSEFVESDNKLKTGYEYIGMGKATFEYTVDDYYAPHTYQIFFRSSDNFTDDEGVAGKLAFNHNYAISLKVTSNVSGTIHVNPYDDIREKKDDETVADYNAYLVAQETAGKIQLAKDAENTYKTDKDGVYVTDHVFDLVANEEKEINLVFRHDDCGYIYQTTIYDNMGTALHIQLADLGWDTEANESRGRTIFSVYDVQFKDLGEADNPVECDESKHAGYVDPDAPVIPDEPAVMSLDDSPKATKASLEVSEDGTKALFIIEGTVDLSKFDNDATKAQAWLNATHMDLQIAGGSWTLVQFNREATVNAEAGTFVIKYDITRLEVSTGNGSEAYGGHFTEKEASEQGYSDNHYRDLKLDAEHAVHGTSITVGTKKYTLVNYNGSNEMISDEAHNWGQQWNYGCVAVKVENA